jgi:acyl-[acyl-carrier-protein]-phospholipid O-acyltransferase/long-chain-fatty-acid--[acyl-carrier-protein] ligase
MEKFPEFPWTKDIFEISSWLKGLVKSPYRLIGEFILLLLPPKISAYLLCIPAKVVQEEATLLFTSGSSGEPKGVVLTHANILSNCQQIERLNLFDHEAKILANLPLFHSFGFTVATCFPILYNIPIVTVPSPLDVKLGLQAIRNEKITFLLGTPTFLRGFLSRAKKEDFISLRYVVAGAEKSSDSFKENWEKFADCSYLEGYGLTETSPGISFNLPWNGSRKGSVGKLFTSIECKTIHPETRCDQSLGESGLLCFRGPNIFKGYLDEIEKTNEVLTDEGWFITGDLGYIDNEGFLYIEGRLSRFSKIGGEMVPHGTLEDEVRKILDPNRDENFGLVIIGQPDESKGEQLILVIDKEINFPELRKKLTLNGIPNLWIPKKIKKIKEIPILSTGKTDIFKLEKELEW